MHIAPDKIKLFHTISKVHQALFRASDKMLAERVGISTTQNAVLLYLNHNAAVSMGDVATAVGIKLTSMSGLIDRMEKKGLIKRERNTEDARTVLLSLTEAGQGVVDKTGPWVKQYNDTLLDTAGTPEELAVFAAVCRRLILKVNETEEIAVLGKNSHS